VVGKDPWQNDEYAPDNLGTKNCGESDHHERTSQCRCDHRRSSFPSVARRREAAMPVSIATRVRHEFDLARQCRKELRNWPAVLIRVGLNHLGWSYGVFTVTSRGGVTLRAPNHRTSWWSLVDVLVLDDYRLRDVSWEDPFAVRTALVIGANVGSFTCALAARLPEATFTCVEPSPSTLTWLRLNLARNGLTGRATVVPAALAEADGETELWASENAFSSASLSPRKGGMVTVQGMSFGSLVATAGGKAEIVSLSCLGGELAAIAEAYAEVWATVEQLFLEYGPTASQHFEEMRARLGRFGLDLVWHHRIARFPGSGKAYFARAR